MNNIQKTNLQNNFKRLRISAGLTQEQVAEKLFISRSCWANYETGRRTPTVEMMQKIADCFNVGIYFLLDESGDKESLAYLCENDINYAIAQKGYLDLSRLHSESRSTVIEVYNSLRIKEKVIKEQGFKKVL